jgi:hypothetical protein
MSVTQQQRHTKRTILSASVAAIAAGVLAGCGGTAGPNVAPQSSGAVQPSLKTAAQSNPDAGGSRGQTHASRGAHGDAGRRARSGVGRAGGVQRARPTAAVQNDDVSTTGAKGQNPCALVSTSEAEAITSHVIAGRIEAPQGPTCIYATRGSTKQVTLAVETVSFANVAHQMTKPKTVVVGGRGAYCGKLGTATLLVPLSRGRVLNVTAPCAIARQFAATALSRIAS